MIGAGAVVTKDVPAHALVLGNPGRIAGHVCRCGGRLARKGRKARCEICRAEYALTGRGMATLVEAV